MLPRPRLPAALLAVVCVAATVMAVVPAPRVAEGWRRPAVAVTPARARDTVPVRDTPPARTDSLARPDSVSAPVLCDLGSAADPAEWAARAREGRDTASAPRPCREIPHRLRGAR